jgi:hypothetical protein
MTVQASRGVLLEGACSRGRAVLLHCCTTESRPAFPMTGGVGTSEIEITSNTGGSNFKASIHAPTPVFRSRRT